MPQDESHDISPEEVDALAETLARYNEAYRRGAPLISDGEYDRLVEKLRAAAPDHSFLAAVEPETFAGKSRVKHPVPMLSIEKAYSREDLERFISRVARAAEEIGIANVIYRATAKLDGVAGRDDGTMLVTRGDGRYGFDVTSAYGKGVVAQGGRGGGLGEVVIRRSYFESHLADRFEHPRNLVVGIIGSDQVNTEARKALADGAVRFVSYDTLADWKGSGEQLVGDIEEIYQKLVDDIDYPVDGMVAQVENTALREHMGATAHHYRWQIAFKKKGETAVTRVDTVVWQVGRTGNVTPVMEVEPVKLSGATIRRVTAHNAAVIEESRIGAGAEIEIIRSGEVIPKLEQVIQPADHVSLPAQCPSCSEPLVREEKFLRCINTEGCRAQIVQRIRHWFRILGSADWFGIRSIEKLVDGGWDTLEKIYGMKVSDFEDLGFGPVQSANLSDALRISRTQPIEDWRLLASFGVPDLGIGDSRKLLAHYPLESLTDIEPEDIEAIHGFGVNTSRSIHSGLHAVAGTIGHMLGLGFSLLRTPLAREMDSTDSPVAGKSIVFTGKMTRGTRNDMQEQARQLGAKVQTAVNSKTDYLVCGENVGKSKIEKAERLGTTILAESAYAELIDSSENR